MSIPGNQLNLAVKDTTFTLNGTQPVIRSTFQVVAPSFGVVIAETMIDQTVATFGQFEVRDDLAWRQARSWFAAVREWHAARETLENYSQHDAALVLADWTITPDGNAWTLSHPVCGTFAGVALPLDNSGRPTLLGRLTAIIAHVLPPSTWGFAESMLPETLSVWCIPVGGAASYNVYSDQGAGGFVLLGSVPDHEPHTLDVPAGYYRVRIAPVTPGGVAGILGNQIVVQVEGGEGEAMSAPESSSAPVSFSAPKTSTPKPTVGERLKTAWNKARGK